MATLGVFLQFLPLAEALIPERWFAPLEIYTQKKAALLQGDEALAMQVGEGKDIMSVLRESESGPFELRFFEAGASQESARADFGDAQCGRTWRRPRRTSWRRASSSARCRAYPF